MAAISRQLPLSINVNEQLYLRPRLVSIKYKATRQAGKSDDCKQKEVKLIASQARFVEMEFIVCH